MKEKGLDVSLSVGYELAVPVIERLRVSLVHVARLPGTAGD